MEYLIFYFFYLKYYNIKTRNSIQMKHITKTSYVEFLLQSFLPTKQFKNSDLSGLVTKLLMYTVCFRSI